jgi:UDP-N-acetylglucosamine--N-acetylmuramyl-(pentapeptide) pyrophosphoryl-undecaprenol N-acetylglucosamine transferase
VAVADELGKRQGAQFTALFAGSAEGMEKNIVPSRGYEFTGLNVRPLIRKLTLKNFSNGYYVVKSLFEASDIIDDFKPDYVVGTGGFVSFPVIMSASMKGKRTLIHEPNVVPGLANKALSYFSSVVSVGFSESKKYFPSKKVRVTGNPVRETLLTASKQEGCKEFGLNPDKKTVLIMPGSRAAKKINRVMLDAMPVFARDLKDVQFLWMCGDEAYDNILLELKKQNGPAVKLMKFIDRAELAYAAADAAVLRAGASTLSEITAVGMPAILVPYPYATGNHQEKNARLFREKGAAVLINDGELTAKNLVESVRHILEPEKNSGMRKILKASYAGNGAVNIADIIESTGQGDKHGRAH